MITGKGDEKIAAAAIQNGAKEYLKKGTFSQQDLLLSITMALEKREMSRVIKKQNKILEKRANTDPLTNLLNRSTFIAKLEKIFSLCKIEENFNFGLMFIDLDKFKQVNDNFGHLVGDHLIQKAASSIKKCIRKYDLLARIGGDEFVICFRNLQKKNIAEKIFKRIQDKFKDPFLIEGHKIYISVSIGVVIANSSYKDPKDLLRDADIAMYQAKNTNNAGHLLFKPGMWLNLKDKKDMEQDLQEAVQKRDLEVFYQPIFSINTNQIKAVEALLRWKHKKEKIYIPPSEFIPIAEKSSLINELGEFVLEESCKALHHWQESGVSISLNVNISPSQLYDTNLIKNIKKTLLAHRIQPHNLCLEITENCLHKDPQESQRKLDILSEMGIKLALDDFGTGYSSLSHLKNFPIRIVKIDRSFVKDIPQDKGQVAICKGLIFLANGLHLELIAEGVEDKIQMDLLKKLKCEYAQGYLLAKPMKFADCNKFLMLQRNVKLGPVTAPVVPETKFIHPGIWN